MKTTTRKILFDFFFSPFISNDLFEKVDESLSIVALCQRFVVDDERRCFIFEIECYSRFVMGTNQRKGTKTLVEVPCQVR